MAAYRRVYDSRHLQADCQEPGSAPEPYAWQSRMGYLFSLRTAVQFSSCAKEEALASVLSDQPPQFAAGSRVFSTVVVEGTADFTHLRALRFTALTIKQTATVPGAILAEAQFNGPVEQSVRRVRLCH